MLHYVVFAINRGFHSSGTLALVAVTDGAKWGWYQLYCPGITQEKGTPSCEPSHIRFLEPETLRKVIDYVNTSDGWDTVPSFNRLLPGDHEFPEEELPWRLPEEELKSLFVENEEKLRKRGTRLKYVYCVDGFVHVDTNTGTGTYDIHLHEKDQCIYFTNDIRRTVRNPLPWFFFLNPIDEAPVDALPKKGTEMIA